MIPKRLKIGGKFWKIDLIKGLSKETGHKGESALMTNIIRLDSELPEDELWSTFIHEILEAINYCYQFDWPHDRICVLEEVLYQVFKDNKLEVK